MSICPICETQCESQTHPNADAVIFDCGICGRFIADRSFIESKGFVPPQLSILDRAKLAGIVREAQDNGRVLPEINYESLPPLLAGKQLPDALEQADALIDFVARKTRFGEYSELEHVNRWTNRFYLPSAEAFRALAGSLYEQRLLVSKGDGPMMLAFQLTLDGWKRAREIRTVRGPGNQAFVAMWFHGALGKIYEKGFAPALIATGYEPYRVDLAHHNQRIDDEIIAQIRRSKILVADATGGRASVYYEAGLATGLGMPVLWCCNQSYKSYVIDPAQTAPELAEPPTCLSTGWFPHVAFDTSHLPFILWDTAEDLATKLSAKIRGLGLGINV